MIIAKKYWWIYNKVVCAGGGSCLHWRGVQEK